MILLSELAIVPLNLQMLNNLQNNLNYVKINLWKSLRMLHTKIIHDKIHTSIKSDK